MDALQKFMTQASTKPSQKIEDQMQRDAIRLLEMHPYTTVKFAMQQAMIRMADENLPDAACWARVAAILAEHGGTLDKSDMRELIKVQEELLS